MVDREPADAFSVHHGQTISAARLLGDILDLAGRLPDRGHVFNLVRDRYLFTVGFAAALARGQCNILPPNPKPGIQRALAGEYPAAYVLHDGCEVAPELPGVRIEVHGDDDSAGESPWLDPEMTAAISYTSGSTGASAPIPKSLRMFHSAVGMYSQTLLPPPINVVTTVPAQHMYGLELSALMPLWHAVTITPDKPLFPHDVLSALESVPAPRALITTPVHLRALVDSGLRFPSVTRVLSATSPLEPGLAARVEERLATELLDVYGCSEVGCIAWRRITRSPQWTALPVYEFSRAGDGATCVNAGHMDTPVVLQDRLEFVAGGGFSLAGRLGDMVNVGGKRGSLSEMTALLLQTPGVTDGQVFDPSTDDHVPRLAAVYSGTASIKDVRRHLAAYLDAVLVPRPIIQVDALPRNEASKLPRQALMDLFERHGRL